nr:MAG TPA: hypothetical protein [Bacteriophage sp.]
MYYFVLLNHHSIRILAVGHLVDRFFFCNTSCCCVK